MKRTHTFVSRAVTVAALIIVCACVADAQPPQPREGLPNMGFDVEPVERFSSSWATRMREDQPPSATIPALKDLHIETALVEGQQASSVIVTPAGDRYAAAVARIVGAVKDACGVDLPVIEATDDLLPEELLTTGNVIALGNMSTNPVIFRLYCQWLTLLDLKWPGAGGHALLSLHNPFSTGHNVILVGGSDDAGVAVSAGLLAERVAGQNDRVALGWLHEIELGGEVDLPDVADRAATWSAPPSSKKPYAFNSIATAACLYYMTGEVRYLEQFKRLAFSRPGDVPEELVKDYAYWNPANPLVENYHYYSHLVPYLWDLIEESPLFTDDERVYITNKLIEQQDHYDPNDNFGAPNGGRHEIYQMLNIYTGSLYLAKYYPEQRWAQRLANIRAAFGAWYESRTWGELDNIAWLPTSIEPIIGFFLLDGSWERFVEAGGVSEMISPQRMLWTGSGSCDVNGSQSLNMMHKAAWLLDDPGCVWLARQAPYDLEVFRIGQSWWPGPELSPQPPEDLVGRISIYGLAPHYWRQAGEPFPIEQGYQFAVWRNTLDQSGDFLQLDGCWLCNRLPYHLSTPYIVRIGGKLLLDGYAQNLTIRREGMVQSGRIPQAAALTGHLAGDGIVWLESLTPNASHASWRRSLLHIEGRRTIVVDEATAVEAGPLELTCDWSLVGGSVRLVGDGPSSMARSRNAVLACSGADNMSLSGSTVSEVVARDVAAGERITLVNVLAPAADGDMALRRIADHIHLLDEATVICTDPVDEAGLSTDARLAWLSPETVFLAGATRFRLGAISVEADQPITLAWNAARATMTVTSEADTEMRATSATSNAMTVQVRAGEKVTEELAPGGYAEDLAALAGELASREPTVAQADTGDADTGADWRASWRLQLPGRVIHMRVQPASAGGRVWVGCEGGLAVCLTAAGKILSMVELGSPIRSLCVAEDEQVAAALDAIVGLDDDRVIALSPTGEIIWEQTAEVAPKFWYDGHWRAPWFTDPASNHGVEDVIIARLDDETPEVVLGRACTVEFRRLSDGELIERVPIEWGEAATLATAECADGGRCVVAGKDLEVGHPNASLIGPDRALRSQGSYSGLPPGHTRIGGWSTQGIAHLRAADLDGDGREELALICNGTWNDLRVYRSTTQEPVWARAFGPGKSMQHFNADLELVDLDGDGKLEVITCGANGWVWVFSSEGDLLWAQHPSEEATALTASRALVVSGDAAGSLRAFDVTGAVVETASLDSGITVVRATDPNAEVAFIAATERGGVRGFVMPGSDPDVSVAPPQPENELDLNGGTVKVFGARSGDDGAVTWLSFGEEAGVFGGEADVSAPVGGALRITLGGETILDWTCEEAGEHIVAMPSSALRNPPGHYMLWLSGDAQLDRLRLSMSARPGTTVEVPADADRTGWITVRASDYLPAESRGVTLKDNYSSETPIIYGFGRSTKSVTWNFEVARAGEYTFALSHAGTIVPNWVALRIDGEHLQPTHCLTALPPTRAWGLNPGEWRLAQFVDADGEAVRFHLSEGTHTLTLDAIESSMNVESWSLLPAKD